MPRKKLTPEQKKAWGEKMKAAKEKKAMERAQPQVTPQVGTPTSTPAAEPMSQNTELEVSPPDSSAEENVRSDDVQTLLRRIEELERQRFFPAQPTPQLSQQPQVTHRGITGTLTKYSVNPKDYPSQEDILTRLLDERRLQLQNFNRNWWDIEFQVSTVNYDTKDGIHVREPKFQVRLIRIIEDPETGEPSNRRYTLHKVTLFEDPDAAIQVANQHGIEIPEELEQDFLNEMRYLRIRDWVLESFYPPKPTQAKANKTETVIGNRLVEVYEINSADSESIPFSQLNKKL
jgi:hypothetical protein